MIIFHYSPMTGELQSAGQADPNPMEPGNYIIPAFATEIEPPAAEAGYIAVFANGEWTVVEDHRGQVAWVVATKQQITIANLGPIPAGITLMEPGPHDVWNGSGWSVDLTQARAAQCLVVNSAWLTANLGTFLFAGHPVSADTIARGDIATLAAHVALFDAFPATFAGYWKAEDDAHIPMPDVSDFKNMVAAMAEASIANFTKAQQLKLQISQAATLEGIAAVIW
jgi:hypothetical protein